MIYILYDRHLKIIGNPYRLEQWRRTQRAVDLDEMQVVGERIPYSVDPFFVTINDKRGHLLFSGLASTPSTDESSNKTTVILKDYRTLWNSEILIDWSMFSGSTVSEYLNFLTTVWLSQVDLGIACDINIDTSEVTSQLDSEHIPLSTGTENCSLSELVFQTLTYYDLYCESFLDVQKKILTYTFKPASQYSVPLRLLDSELAGSEKSFGEFNRVCVYTSTYEKIQEWALTVDNTTVLLPSQEQLVYPAKNRNFIAKDATDDALSEAIYDAVMSLAENRYQESIDLNADRYRSIVDLTTLDFGYSIDVWTDEGFYKSLPVGEIETNSSGQYIVRLGYRVQELTQEL
jgi:hypothetical protein